MHFINMSAETHSVTVITWTGPRYDPYPSFDRIRNTVLTGTQRNWDIHIPAYMINIRIPVLICAGACG